MEDNESVKAYYAKRQQFADDMREARKRAARRERWQAIGEVAGSVIDMAYTYAALTFAAHGIATTIGHPISYPSALYLAFWVGVTVVALRRVK